MYVTIKVEIVLTLEDNTTKRNRTSYLTLDKNSVSSRLQVRNYRRVKKQLQKENLLIINNNMGNICNQLSTLISTSTSNPTILLEK